MHLFESNRKECSKYLLGLHNNFENGFFAAQPSTTSGDRSNDDQKEAMDEDTSGWILSEVLVEVSRRCITQIWPICANDAFCSTSLDKCYGYLHPLLDKSTMQPSSSNFARPRAQASVNHLKRRFTFFLSVCMKWTLV